MEYLAKGPTFIVPTDRYTYGIPDAVRGHAGDNEGSYVDHREESTSELSIGPCMVETITLTKARKIASMWSRNFKAALNEMAEPIIRRYMLLDGQRLVSIESKGHTPLLFADSHASFDDALWLKQFPEHRR